MFACLPYVDVQVTLETDLHCKSPDAVYNGREEYGYVANSLIRYEYMVSNTLLMCVEIYGA